MIIFAILLLVLICIISLITKKSNDRQENIIKESNPIIKKQEVMTDNQKLIAARNVLNHQFDYYKEFITDEDCKKVVDFWNLQDNKLATYDDYIDLKHSLYEDLSDRKREAVKLKDEENNQAKERILSKVTYGEKVTLLASLIDNHDYVWIKLEKELNGENK